MSSSECEGGEVGAKGLVELPRDVALQASDDFFLGSAFGESSFHVFLRVGAVSESDDDDHVECPIGLAVPGVVEPVSAGSPGRSRDGCRCTQVGERCFRAETVDVFACGNEEGSGVAGSDTELAECCGCCDRYELVEFYGEFVDFVGEDSDPPSDTSQRDLGCPGRISRVGVTRT